MSSYMISESRWCLSKVRMLTSHIGCRRCSGWTYKVARDTFIWRRSKRTILSSGDWATHLIDAIKRYNPSNQVLESLWIGLGSKSFGLQHLYFEIRSALSLSLSLYLSHCDGLRGFLFYLIHCHYVEIEHHNLGLFLFNFKMVLWYICICANANRRS